jgi:hypothetical protein
VTRPGAGGHYAAVSIIIKFFVAPDDPAATDVLDAGPEGVFESLVLGNFNVAEAVVEWESILTDRSFEELVEIDEPRIVCEVGAGSACIVFAVSSALRDKLAAAEDAGLDDLAFEWVRQRAEQGDVFELELARVILGELAGLARSASRQRYELYCWMA